jgi:adenylate kinase family enzyme
VIGEDGRVERVAVVGPGGAGKSTFARELGRRTGLPVIHLDEHYWRPGWVEPPKEDWRARQERLVAGDRWIVDGNYGGTFDVRFARADTVVILDRAPPVCVAAALRRSLRHRGRAVQAAGCPEHLDPRFLRWIWRYRKDSRPRLDAALARHADRLEVVRLASRRAMRDFLDGAAVSRAR